MPPCKNDAARTYKGDEPSPKGLGWCAHAAAAGKTMKGKDGGTWVVAVDKNGTRAWKRASAAAKKPDATMAPPPRVKGAEAVSLTSASHLRFSDGKVLSWAIGKKPTLRDDNYEDSPMTRAHWDAVLSPRDIVLRLERGSPLKDVDVKVSGPATVGKALVAMHRFYSTKLSAADYAALDTELDSWNVLYVSGPADLRKKIRTFGDTKAQYTAFSGFTRSLTPFSSVYTTNFDS